MLIGHFEGTNAAFYDYLRSKGEAYIFDIETISKELKISTAESERIISLAATDKVIAISNAEEKTWHLRRKASLRSPKTICFLKNELYKPLPPPPPKKKHKAPKAKPKTDFTASLSFRQKVNRNYQHLLQVAGKTAPRKKHKKIEQISRDFLFEKPVSGTHLTGPMSPKRNIENRNKYDNKAALGLKNDLKRIRKERELFGTKD
jgi:hypothetical protein